MVNINTDELKRKRTIEKFRNFLNEKTKLKFKKFTMGEPLCSSSETLLYRKREHKHNFFMSIFFNNNDYKAKIWFHINSITMMFNMKLPHKSFVDLLKKFERKSNIKIKLTLNANFDRKWVNSNIYKSDLISPT